MSGLVEQNLHVKASNLLGSEYCVVETKCIAMWLQFVVHCYRPLRSACNTMLIQMAPLCPNTCYTKSGKV
jgi:hypothetical protein